MFQMSGVGPMQGQANVFFLYFPEKLQPAIDRYQNETRRLEAIAQRPAVQRGLDVPFPQNRDKGADEERIKSAQSIVQR